MTHQDKSSDSLLDNLNTPDLPFLDPNSMDAADTVQFDLWTHGTDVLQDTAISAVDDSTHEQRPDANFSRLSTPWWDATQPSDQFSNSTPYPAGDTIGNLPIVAVNYDPFFGHEDASNLPTLSGFVSPRQASIPFPSTLPSAFSPPSQHLLLDVANGLDEPDLSNFFDGDIPNALSALGDPSSKTSLAILDSAPTAVSTLPNPRNLSMMHTLDQPEMSVMIPEINERQHRPILPKPPLAAEPAPLSRAQPTPAHQRPSAPMSTSPLRPTDVVPHQPGITGIKRKRSLIERKKANQLIPSSMLGEFPASSMDSRTSVREQSPKGRVAKRTRAKKGSRRCLRCHVQRLKCDGESPCVNCWKLASASQLTNFRPQCIDSDIRQLNFLGSTFQHLAILSDTPSHPGSDFSNISEAEYFGLSEPFWRAINMLIAMVLDSPIEAGYGRMLAEVFISFNTSKPGQKVSSEADQSMLWHPRNPTQHYQTLSHHPLVQQWSHTPISLIILIFQHDNMATLTGLPRSSLCWFSAACFGSFFHRLWKILKTLRPNDATKSDRDKLLPLLRFLRDIVDWNRHIGLFWQAIYLKIYDQEVSYFATPSGNYDPQIQVKKLLLRAVEVFEQAVMPDPIFACLLERLEQIRRHLDQYILCWLKRLDPENVFQEGGHFYDYYFMAQSLKHLVLINDNDIPSGPGAKQPQGHYDGLCQSISRICIYEPYMSVLKRYLDLTDTDSGSDAFMPGSPAGGSVDKAEAVADQFFEAVLADSQTRDLRADSKLKLDVIEWVKSHDLFWS
ncbi:uncharacterized protein PAC_17404 [Phialocephala subalpina]|uniref:Zn(2)-C6 fungal-type domain-containing protein n=1 Tax=Phialocephala subalpina TaxID=576137 RepID=A0A1L7XR72_9HELO|nr:uncharacterized protein PAC_17404 [Phialocephala subalpina]